MKKNKSIVFQTLVDFIFPRHCYGCETNLEFYEEFLCLSCQINLPLTELHLTKENPLFQKIKSRFTLQAATSLFYFEKDGVLSRLINLFKYKGAKKIAVFLGDWLGESIAESPFFNEVDGIVPVPLHPAKKRKRGYNQSYIIATALSNKMKLPLFSDLLIRVKNTTALALLGESEREQEVKNAFKLNPKKTSHPQHLLLVDDVLTTGSTLAACASALFVNHNIKLSIAVLACRL